MKHVNWKAFAAGLACGLVFGFGLFYLFAQNRLGTETSQPYQFLKTGPNGMLVMRYETITGKAWISRFTNGWNGPWHWELVEDHR